LEPPGPFFNVGAHALPVTKNATSTASWSGERVEISSDKSACELLVAIPFERAVAGHLIPETLMRACGLKQAVGGGEWLRFTHTARWDRLLGAA
jgi:hypothetical protein